MDLLLSGGSGEVNAMGHAVTPEATENDLSEALAALERGEVEYVVLMDGARFMQAAGDARSGYVLEYNSDADDTLFRAQGEITGAQIVDAFAAFLNHDPVWRTTFAWERFKY